MKDRDTHSKCHKKNGEILERVARGTSLDTFTRFCQTNILTVALALIFE